MIFFKKLVLPIYLHFSISIRFLVYEKFISQKHGLEKFKFQEMAFKVTYGICLWWFSYSHDCKFDFLDIIAQFLELAFSKKVAQIPPTNWCVTSSVGVNTVYTNK